MCVLLWIIFFSQTSEVSAINTPDSEPRGYKYSQSRDNRQYCIQLVEAGFLTAHRAQPRKVISFSFPSARARDAKAPAQCAQHIEASARPAVCHTSPRQYRPDKGLWRNPLMKTCLPQGLWSGHLSTYLWSPWDTAALPPAPAEYETT